MAFASIYVPDFMVQAVLRIDACPDPRGEVHIKSRAMAIIDGAPPAENVLAANEAALRAGIRPGMTQSQAAQFPSVDLRPRSRPQEQAAHAALLDLGWSVSPRVEDTAADTIVLDLAGLASLFGSEEKIACHLAQRASGFGLSAHVAVAACLEVALHAARGFPGVTIIPAGEESRRLGPLPVAVLSPPPEVLETLERWGVSTCAALASLPVLDLSERLGQVGVHLHECARGASLRSLVLAQPDLRFAEEMPLESAVAELEPLAFLLARLLGQLCARLAARSLAVMAIRLSFDLEASAENEEIPVSGRRQIRRKAAPRRYENVLRLPVPMRDPKMLLQLLRLQLQADPPAAPIRKIGLVADPALPRVAQGGLFLPPSPDPEKLELIIARLAHLVGDSNVGSPQLLDTHRPGAFRMDRFQPSPSGKRCEPRRSKPGTGFRMFRPPLPTAVQLTDGRPVRISIRGRRGAVVVASGPWRTSGDWWNVSQRALPSQEEGAWRQDEWDIEVHFDVRFDARFDAPSSPEASPRGLYRVYFDAICRGWFVRGMYD